MEIYTDLSGKIVNVKEELLKEVKEAKLLNKDSGNNPVTTTLDDKMVSHILKICDIITSDDVDKIGDGINKLNLAGSTNNDNASELCNVFSNIKDQLTMQQEKAKPSGINAKNMIEFVKASMGNKGINNGRESFIKGIVCTINQWNKTGAWMEQKQNSEMALQQMPYNPFASIIASYRDREIDHHYIAEELVNFSSHIWNVTDSRSGSGGYFSSKPDGGIKLTKKLNALCLMELKKGDDDLSKPDIGKCVLGLSITAKWMRDEGCRLYRFDPASICDWKW